MTHARDSPDWHEHSWCHLELGAFQVESRSLQRYVHWGCAKPFFPSWEWEGYIDTESQAININSIFKAVKEQKIYILKKTSINI